MPDIYSKPQPTRDPGLGYGPMVKRRRRYRPKSFNNQDEEILSRRRPSLNDGETIVPRRRLVRKRVKKGQQEFVAPQAFGSTNVVPSHLVDKYEGSVIEGYRKPQQQLQRPFYGNETENEVVRGGSRDGRCKCILK